MTATNLSETKTAKRPISKDERKILIASSLGTVFEWYDFFLYGSLAAVIAKQFFAKADPTTGLIFALLAFAAGFIVRPFGALVFGRLGDLIGRKYTFLIAYYKGLHLVVSMAAQQFMLQSMHQMVNGGNLLLGYKQLQHSAYFCRYWLSWLHDYFWVRPPLGIGVGVFPFWFLSFCLVFLFGFAYP